MTGGGRRNVWLRMTDSIGVTEPGKKPERPSPRMLVLQAVGYTVLTVIWSMLAFRTQDNIVYLIAGVLSLVLAVAAFVMLLQSKRRTDGPKGHRDPSSGRG